MGVLDNIAAVILVIIVGVIALLFALGLLFYVFMWAMVVWPLIVGVGLAALFFENSAHSLGVLTILVAIVGEIWWFVKKGDDFMPV